MRRAWPWLALVGAVLVGAVLIASISSAPGRPLDPGSATHDGSRALARLLARYGARVDRVDTVTSAVQSGAAAVLVTAPDDYSAAQLRRLRSAGSLLVLVAPDRAAVTAVLPGADLMTAGRPDPEPGCADPGARAVGALAPPADATLYRYPGRCYGGLLVVTPHVALLGSAQLLRNDRLADTGVAATAVNTITRSRTIGSVAWLLAGSDAGAGGGTSVWALFPPGAHRAFWWMLAVGGLLAVWRARRLGGAVGEPLPVVVRAAEAVEGHGRLYERAGARDRAAAALRAAAAARIGARLGLPRGAGPGQVGVAVAPLVDAAPARTVALLDGPPPADDAGLMRLARDLDALQADVHGRIRA